MDAIYYVYEHWRADKNVCFYVGKGCRKRAYCPSKRSARHKLVIAKLARLGLQIDVRIVSSGLTEPQAFSAEIERISYWRSIGVRLVNATNGGEGASGTVFSPEARARVSRALAARIVSAETRAKLSAAKKAMSAETRAKIGAASRSRVAIMSPERRAEVNAKISVANKGRVISAEGRKNYSNAQKGKIVSRITRARVSATNKIGSLRRQNQAKYHPDQLCFQL